jgi:hypothetical protein
MIDHLLARLAALVTVAILGLGVGAFLATCAVLGEALAVWIFG